MAGPIPAEMAQLLDSDAAEPGGSHDQVHKSVSNYADLLAGKLLLNRRLTLLGSRCGMRQIAD